MSLTVATLDHVINVAGWAPSAHNTQPWLPQITSIENSRAHLTVRVDPERTLPVTDPYAMDLGLSMGCWVEALSIASASICARIDNLEVSGEDHSIVIDVDIVEDPDIEGYEPHSGAMFESAEVLDRHVDRGRLRPRTERMEAALHEFFATNFAYKSGRIASAQIPETVWTRASRYAQAAAVSPREALDETLAWLRFDDKDPRYYQDGLTAETLRVPRSVARTCARIIRGANDTVLNAFSQATVLGTMLPAKPSRKSADRIVLALHAPHPSEVPARDWVDAGRDLLRLWLLLGRHDLRVAVESQLKDTRLSAAMLCDVLRRTDPKGDFVPFAVFSVGESTGPVPHSHRLVEQTDHQMTEQGD